MNDPVDVSWDAFVAGGRVRLICCETESMRVRLDVNMGMEACKKLIDMLQGAHDRLFERKIAGVAP